MHYAEERARFRSALISYSLVASILSLSTYILACGCENFEHSFGFGVATFDVLLSRLKRWWLQLICLTATAVLLSLTFQRIQISECLSQNARVEGSLSGRPGPHAWTSGLAELIVAICVVYFNVNVVFSFLTSLTLFLGLEKHNLHSWSVGVGFTLAKYLSALAVRPLWNFASSWAKINPPGDWRSVALGDLIRCAAFDVLAPLSTFTVKDLTFLVPDILEPSKNGNYDANTDNLIHGSFASFILSVFTSEVLLTAKYLYKKRFDYSSEVRKLCTCVVFAFTISVVNPTVLVVAAASTPVMALLSWLRYLHARSSCEDILHDPSNELMILLTLPGRIWYSTMFFAVNVSWYDRVERLLNNVFAKHTSSKKYQEEVEAALASMSFASLTQVALTVCLAYIVLGLIGGAMSRYGWQRKLPLEHERTHLVSLCGLCPITNLWTCTSMWRGLPASLCRGVTIAVGLIFIHFGVCVSGNLTTSLFAANYNDHEPSESMSDVFGHLNELLYSSMVGWCAGPSCLLLAFHGVGAACVRCCPRRPEEAAIDMGVGSNPIETLT